MTQDITSISSDKSVIEAAKIMKQLDVGAVPVVQGDKCIGMITDRDIVLRVVAQGQDPQNTQVNAAMTSDPITASPDMDVHAAADLMAERQIRRLPVVEKERLVGIVALGDLAVTNIFQNEAGDALSEISEPARPLM
ncbi:CBS domain-containing protein [Heliobacillus mobilis]|uniref:CBS domain-containing protein n=2 Tax=Heliobacterium mobile TaxID=28064 RepID=A0A6I3SJH1_HELMO|nr:CBS domain-containing protein [Heliobacterium mobile]